MLTLPIQFGALPSPYCFTSHQQLLADFSAAQYVQFPANFTPYNYGPDTPSPENRDKPWFRTNADGNPTGKWIFSQGLWLSEHPAFNPVTQTVTRFLQMLEIEEADIPALDGGAAGTVTDTSGPMWELASEFAARVPIGAGTLPSGDTLAIGDTGGEEKHILTQAEMPTSAEKNLYHTNYQLGPSTGGIRSDDFFSLGVAMNFPAGGGVGHNTLPPFYVIRVLRKSLRKYWSLPA